MRQKFKKLLKTRGLIERRNIFYLAGKALERYLQRYCQERGLTDLQRQSRDLAAAGIALGHMMNAPSVQQFRRRFLAYWHPSWDKIPE